MAAKPVKYPKSIGACADLLYKLREERLALDKKAAEAKSAETALINHIIDNLDKESTGAAGKTHMVRVVTKQKPQIKDFEKVWAWAVKNKRPDIFQRRLSEQAVADTFAQPRSKGIPGIDFFNAVTVSLTKVK